MKNYINLKKIGALLVASLFAVGTQAALLSQSTVPLNDGHNGFTQPVTIDSVTASNPESYNSSDAKITIGLNGRPNGNGDSFSLPVNTNKKTFPLSSQITRTPPVFNSNGSINYYPGSSILEYTLTATEISLSKINNAYIVSWNRNLPVKISSSSSNGKCLNQPGWSTGQGVDLVQWDCQGQTNANDTWNLIPMGDYYHIAVQNGNLCLNVPGNSTATGQKLVQWSCQGDSATNDQWSIVENSDKTFSIQSRSSGLCVNMAGGTNSSPVTQDSCTIPTTKLHLPYLPEKWGAAAHL
ncbi:RICIN domain-containing protein [Burkholderia ubonensis]|uniref:RICIN domain-containing protein n=1 Tax=Burkholderia ubonensis TaxID=101571 RepID=UPI001E44BB93|nr:RICIN domain-containing protein [Burkholderia ubonensis]